MHRGDAGVLAVKMGLHLPQLLLGAEGLGSPQGCCWHLDGGTAQLQGRFPTP